MDRCRCWPGGQENCQSEGSSVSTHMSICSLKDLKSRPGTRRVFRHLFPRVSTSTPTFSHQILLWFLSCGSVLEPYSTLQFSLSSLRNKNQPHHQFFPVHGQTVDRQTDRHWDFSRTSSVCQYHFTLGPRTHAVQQTCLWDPEGCT